MSHGLRTALLVSAPETIDSMMTDHDTPLSIVVLLPETLKAFLHGDL